MVFCIICMPTKKKDVVVCLSVFICMCDDGILFSLNVTFVANITYMTMYVSQTNFFSLWWILFSLCVGFDQHAADVWRPVL